MQMGVPHPPLHPGKMIVGGPPTPPLPRADDEGGASSSGDLGIWGLEVASFEVASLEAASLEVASFEVASLEVASL